MIESRQVITHSIHDAHANKHLHFGWDNSLEPILEMAPGEDVFFSVREAPGGILGPASTVGRSG